MSPFVFDDPRMLISYEYVCYAGRESRIATVFETRLYYDVGEIVFDLEKPFDLYDFIWVASLE